MYIAIEGLKGTGKSTLIHALLPCIQAYFDHDSDVQTLSPTKPIPNHPLEAQFYELQNNDGYLQALYAQRSNYHASAIDWDADLIISDRSLLTSLAVRWHHTIDKDLSPMQHYQNIRQQEPIIALPDVVIQLHAPDDTLMTRYKTRTRAYGQYEETTTAMAMMRRNYQQMYEWLRSDHAQAVINKPIYIYQYDTASHTTEQICSDVLCYIEQHLSYIKDEKIIRTSYSLSV